MSDRFDAVVVGSGFGGAVTACRLAERGVRVLVLERGRRWRPAEYPRAASDPWIWDQRSPHKRNGWIDFRMFGRMAVAQGAGVGGGSLIYANVVVDAKPEIFKEGWPAEITFDELRPYYDRVAGMLGAQRLPDGQLTERFRLMQEAARKAGHEDRFRALPLAVTFDPEWHYGLPDPFSGRHSRTWTNPHGKLQGTCVHCGNCDIGCQVRAKNTLDLNYIARAEQHGADVRPLHMVTSIARDGDGYRVHYDRLVDGKRLPGNERAKIVVLAAGSLGSTEILLRCRDEHGTLPDISALLGRNWSSNGDFLTPARYGTRAVAPTEGPTITCALDFLDGSVDGERFFIEDGGFPNLLHNFEEPEGRRGRRTTLLAVERVSTSVSLSLSPRRAAVMSRFAPTLTAATRMAGRFMGPGGDLHDVMPWFAQGIDAGDGRLYLGRRWLAPWKRQLKMDWDVKRSRAVINAIVAMHLKLSDATGGRALVPASWSLLSSLVTPHPLGGCVMGSNRDAGVVDHRGGVFGYPGLYVADGAIVPRPLGLNPSKTIAALAERVAAHIDT